MPTKNGSKTFQDFTNLYELSKTLRFELRPVGNTQKMLEENNVFEKDKTRQEKYKKVKPYFDKLHREFVAEALSEAKLENLDEYFEIFKKWQKDKKDKKYSKELEQKEKNLREQILGFINRQAEEYSKKYSFLKKKDYNLFFEKEVFQLLKEKYGLEDDAFVVSEATNEKVSIFDEWEKFTGYFLKFHETRKNFYKNDGTSTAISTRAIDQNLKRFCDNWLEYKKVKEKIDFCEVEDNFNIELNEVLNPLNYSNYLLQEGIDKYNNILGGKTLDNGKKLKGMNEFINEYRQTNKGEKPRFLKKLDKQILGEKEKTIFGNEIDKENIFERLKIFRDEAVKRVETLKKIIGKLKNENDFDLEKVYISKEAANTIAYKWCQSAHDFEGALAAGLGLKEREGKFSFSDFISLAALRAALEQNGIVWKDRYYKNDDKKSKGFVEGADDIWKQFLLILEFEFGNNFTLFDNQKNEFDKYLGGGDFQNKKDDKENIRGFCDAALNVYSMGKYFALEKKRKWEGDEYDLCSVFYDDPETGYRANFYENAYEEVVKTYNDIRNFLTRKPWEDVQKWKLNFENSTLADGWDKNKEVDNSAVLLRKDGKYFLALMKKGCNKIFDGQNLVEMAKGIESDSYEKMVYKLLPGANKMLPKVFFSKSKINFFNPSDEILKIKNHSSHTKSGNPQKGFEKKEFNLVDCHKLIDFFKESLYKHEEWKDFDFKFSETSAYQDISDFYREVESGGYKISWQSVSEEFIKEKNQNSELYLFEIYNRDFAEKAEGKKKLHTMYFESLFSEINKQKGFTFKLNGQAEIFFRPKAIEEKKVKRNFKREIIEKKRYTKDKIFFHCPISLNRGKGNIFQFNQKIDEALADNRDINIIGIDRGEKHLAYYSVIKQNGDIIEMGSLNEINSVNYEEKLHEKAKQREGARKSWDEVETIKDLKKGYISQVVRKLADLAIEHNAIIVFEDLNMRFKQVRGGIEKSVYQQLEKALIDKLNFLVEKGEEDPERAGHLLKAYQLAAPFTTFKDMGKQTGIIFYTQAGFTSVTDPVTGFRKNIYIKNSAPIKKIKEEFFKFKKIAWDDAETSYLFEYDINDFNKNCPKKTWTIYAKAPCLRRENKNGYWECKEYKTNDKLRELFGLWGFDNLDGDILDQMQAKDANGDFENQTKEFDGKKRNFYQALVYIFNLVIDIRNSSSKSYKKDEKGNLQEVGENADFIASPVKPFFTTPSKYSGDCFGGFADKYIGNDKKKFLAEYNGDANGAYNIARKGIIILEKISEWKKKNQELKEAGKKEKTYPDLFISNIDWDKRIREWAEKWYGIK